MNTPHLRIFQRQVLDQCKFLLLAAHGVNKALNRDDVDSIFFGLQNLLNAGANISKTLWGAGGKHAEQRKRLRDSIQISDSSPLRDVNMRNNFEHMDERVDRWWANSRFHRYVDKIVGPREMISGVEPTDTFRWFNPSTTDIIFWGQEFNLQALVDEAQRLLPLLEAEVAKPHSGLPGPK